MSFMNQVSIGKVNQLSKQVSDNTQNTTNIKNGINTNKDYFPSKIGVNVHLQQFPNTDLNLIKNTGFTYIRDALGWSGIETTQGVYNFASKDASFINNPIAAGLIPYMILYGGNTLYSATTALTTTPAQQAFANFCGAAANRYKNKGIIWEILNEPNGLNEWSPRTATSSIDYANTAKLAYAQIKANDPTAFVVAPAVSNTDVDIDLSSQGWFETAMANGLLDGLDGLSIHPYRNKNPETVIADVTRLRSMIAKYTDRKIPIICGEWGYSATPSWDGNGNNAIVPDEQTQANYYARMLLINSMLDIPITIIYDWQNDGVSTSLVEDNFGVTQNDATTYKAAGTLIKSLTNTLATCVYNERLDMQNQNDYVLVYIDVNNKPVYVYWTSDTSHTVSINGSFVTITNTPQFIIGTNSSLKLALKKDINHAIKQLKGDLSYYGFRTSHELKNLSLNNIIENGEWSVYSSDSTNVQNLPVYPFWGAIKVVNNHYWNHEVIQLAYTTGNAMYTRASTVTGGTRTWKSWILVSTNDGGTQNITLGSGITFNHTPTYKHYVVGTADRVIISGDFTFANTTVGQTVTLGTIPSAYAPIFILQFPVRCSGGNLGFVAVDTSGNITLSGMPANTSGTNFQIQYDRGAMIN